MTTVTNIIKEITEDIEGVKQRPMRANVGSVVEVKDEVVFFSGFDKASFGEAITFKDGTVGIIVDVHEDSVAAIVFGNYDAISEGDEAAATGEVFAIPVSDDYLGRTVDGIARPIDGGAKIGAKKSYPVERIAPGVIERYPVDTPLQTGIKVIDAIIPIGRGQRELIIGDRGSGKSTIAIDTVINQKDQNVICVYCIIGQKRATTANLIDTLTRGGAMKYSVVVAATASDPASMQYIAPYVAATIGEYFMHKGKDVLIVYDDLSKHAWAYRQVSLVLRRPSGREAYPGDIFYLHSRLLERSCRIDEKYGGGSMTALPIIETQEGDVSAYIPTNVISITDGQIVLEADLFNAGIRPAVNIGSSVSRVGGTAQTKAMKKVAGKLKFDLAQYREMAAFAQFEGELDDRTKKLLDRGARMTELLKQPKNQPQPLEEQVVVLWAGINGYFDEIPTLEVITVATKFLEEVKIKNKDLLKLIREKKALDETSEEKLKQIIEKFIKAESR